MPYKIETRLLAAIEILEAYDSNRHAEFISASPGKTLHALQETLK